VQEEVAFDPFAMMDEQLDSAFTTVHLRPEPVHTYERASDGELTLVQPRRTLEMPGIPEPNKVQVRESEYIGCCGFPWPTGGRQCVYDSEFMAQLESGAVSSGTRETSRPDRQADGVSEASTTEDELPQRSCPQGSRGRSGEENCSANDSPRPRVPPSSSRTGRSRSRSEPIPRCLAEDVLDPEGIVLKPAGPPLPELLGAQALGEESESPALSLFSPKISTQISL